VANTYLEGTYSELYPNVSQCTCLPTALRRDGQTVMFVAVDRQPGGLVGVADPIKATTPEALRLLRESGLHIVMLTGDSRATAEAAAGVLHPFTGILLSPIFASAAMIFSSVSVIANALRLRRVTL
jgi:P-type E1-E2 ATPase